VKRVMKRLFCVAAASVVLLSSELNVSAAGLKDVFDAEYYAEQYPDLKAAFGNDENALYQHFLNHGIKEGRVMNPIIDVVKYREQYEDLQAAFGNDWDAYVKHYFAFGVNEHRENGTDFDLLAYLAAYEDVKEAYGNDYAAVAKHYAEIGMSEGRNEGSKEFIEAREKAEAEEMAEEEEEAEESKEENDKERIETTTYKSGLKVEDYYDEEGELDESVHYAPNGNVSTISFGYVGNGPGKQQSTYNGNYIRSIGVYDALGERVFSGAYNGEAMGGLVMIGLEPLLDKELLTKIPIYVFDINLNEEGNYVLDNKRERQGRLKEGVYTYDPNGECLTQPE